MAVLTDEQMRKTLPRNGDGVEDFQVTGAIASAKEEVYGVVGDTTEAHDSELVSSAINNYAKADLLDIIYPRDARREESEQATLRTSAERKIGRYLQILLEKKQDQDPTTGAVPPVVVMDLSPVTTAVLPDTRY